MRLTSFFITIALLMVMTIYIKILDNLFMVFAITGTCALSGLVLYRNKRSRTVADAGLGMLYGSVTTFVFLAAFLVWLSYNFPK